MINCKSLVFATSLLATALPGFAQDPTLEDFVAGNLIGTFYHELGHAVIDIESVPVFAQEEDAADVFSIYMIDQLFDEKSATDLVRSTAFGYLAEAEARDEARQEIAWWDTHGPDEQRYFNMACMFYGADPDKREDFAQNVGLPEERAENCVSEYDLADESWGPVFDLMAKRGGGKSITLKDKDSSLTAEVIAEEIEELNKHLRLSRPLTVSIKKCGEANAYYDLDNREMVFCSEFEEHLADLYDRLMTD